MRLLVERLVGNNVLANVVLSIVVIVGIIATLNLTRESMPDIDINYIAVSVSLPGSDPEESEEAISQRIEAAIDGLQGIKQYSTTSYEGGAEVIIEVMDDYDTQEVLDRVRNAIDSISTFPVRAERPLVWEITDEEEVIDIALFGELPERQLKEWAETVRADLQRLPEISLAEITGIRNYEITVEISKDKLMQYGLTFEEVSAAVQQGSLNLPSGVIKAEGEEIRIRTMGRKYTGPEFGSIVVKATPEGDIITLGQVANIRDGFIEYRSYATFDGHPCALIYIEKAPGEDSIAIAEAVHKYVAEKKKSLPPGLQIAACFDDAEFIKGQISLLVKNGIAGLILVVVVLTLFLSPRLSFWIAMGIPISLSGALVLMWLLDTSINQVTLITFIVVLGIIVDDAIVVGEAIYVHRKKGQPPIQAAVEGVLEVGAPVLAAVTTTIMAFIPLMFVPGFIGQLMFYMPVVVISALLVSLVESLFMLPTHLNDLPDPNLPIPQDSRVSSRLRRLHARIGDGLDWFAEHVVGTGARIAVEHRYTTFCVAVGILCVAAGLVGGNVVRVIFWPPVDGNHLRAFVEFPVGTPPEVTRDAVEQTRQAFARVAEKTKTTSGEPLVRHTYTQVYQPHMGRITVEMLSPSQRGVHSQDLAAQWEKEVGVIPGAVQQSFLEESVGGGGPAIELWLQGRDMDALQAASNQLKEKLRKYEGVFQVSDDARSGKLEVRIKLKPEAHTLGLTLSDVAQHLYAGYYGAEPIRQQRGRDDMRVRVRFPDGDRKTISDLEQVRIPTPQGQNVPLLSVATLEMANGYSLIRGSNGMRRIAVTAAVDANKAAPHEVVGDLVDSGYLDNLKSQFALASWSIEGAEEENMETVGGLKRGFLIAILGIYLIVAAIFRSYLQPLIIMVVIPFGVAGAVFGHYLDNIPLTILSFFGIVALAGVVVNDAIVLIECINELMAEGMAFTEALWTGAVRRFRAIMLTTATTSIGLLPLILEQDLQAQVVIPMAVSISAGVLFATGVTLLLIPALLAILNDARRLVYRMIRGTWPTPEEVEPGAGRRAPKDVPVENVSGQATLTS
ncbi:MAG: multidrug transporter AcrB [Candidatus Hydrogenedentota bacterium]